MGGLSLVELQQLSHENWIELRPIHYSSVADTLAMFRYPKINYSLHFVAIFIYLNARVKNILYRRLASAHQISLFKLPIFQQMRALIMAIQNICLALIQMPYLGV